MKKLFGLVLALIYAMNINATELYLVGDATPTGWNFGKLDKTQMTEVSTNVFEWTGVLLATPTGEGFKILTQRDWNPGLHPSEAGLYIDVAGEDVVRLPYSGDPDTKWKVSKTGNYTIRVTLRAEDALVECEDAGVLTIGGVDCVDGVFQLTNATDAVNFANGINDDTILNNCSVVLTQDIDLDGIAAWPTIGTDAHKFIGTFDGQGHRLLNLHIDGTKNEQGFFGVLGAGALIKNLIIDSSMTIVGEGGKCMSAFAGCCNNDGTITFLNCGNEANISGTKQNNAAFVGCNYGGGCKLVFTNCYNTGNISGGWENGAFSGWCGGGATFTNCWNSGSVTEGETWARGTKTMTNCYQTIGDDAGVNKVDAAKIPTGEFCYILNGDQSVINWYQTIGTDATPVPFATSLRVYANGELKCDGTSAGGDLVYSNSSTSQIPPHTYSDGWCSVCGDFDVDYLTPVNGFYEIATINDLNWFAGLVNIAGQNAANAKLTENLVQANDAVYTPIGSTAHVYCGHFDGQGHSVELHLNNPASNYQGLFGVITDGVLIENTIVKGGITGNDFVGGIAGGTNGGASNAKKTIIRNCGNEAAVEAKGANGAGIIGVNMNGSASFRFENVYNIGEIHSGREGGALSGWSGGGWSYFVNCYNTGKVWNGDGGWHASNDFTRHNGTSINNCYYLDSSETSAQDAVKVFTAEELESGALCVKLGDAFHQYVGSGYPVFDETLPNVYGVTVGAAGWATYVAPATVDLSPIKVAGGETYTVTEITAVDVKLGTATSIPADEAIIVEAEEGTYFINTCQNASMDTNVLVAATEDVVADGTQYVLAQVEGVVGFHKVEAGTTIAAGKGYLVVTAGAKMFLPFGDDNTATSIDAVELFPADAAIYNLAGQKMQKLQKGINIINGKKVVIK